MALGWLSATQRGAGDLGTRSDTAGHATTGRHERTRRAACLSNPGFVVVVVVDIQHLYHHLTSPLTNTTMSFRLGLRATPSSSSSAISSASLVLRRPIQTSPLSRASHPAASASQSYIKGTVNDPTTYPPPNAAHGHQHWAVERAISVALLPLTAVAFAKHGASGFLDVALGLSLVAHSHIGE